MAKAPLDDVPIRTEIQFFMDKIFQVSLAYVAGLVTFLALMGSQLVDDFAKSARMEATHLISNLVLLLNIVYLILASACLFAVLKRGLFALTQVDDVSETWRSWELFVRDDEQMSSKRLKSLAWNVDNYYAVPIYLLIFVISAIAALHAITSGKIIAIIFALVLCLGHAIPGWMLWQLRNLNQLCRQKARLSSKKSAR